MIVLGTSHNAEFVYAESFILANRKTISIIGYFEKNSAKSLISILNPKTMKTNNSTTPSTALKFGFNLMDYF